MNFKNRRDALIEKIGNGIAVIPTAPMRQRNADVFYPFRPNSDFYYLTHFPEPNAVAVLAADSIENKFILFCNERDPDREQWDGIRAGQNGAIQDYGATHSYPISDLDKIMPKLIAHHNNVYYPVGFSPSFDKKVIKWLKKMKSQVRKGVSSPAGIMDVSRLIQQMRLRKDKDEIAVMKKAGQITAEAHRRAMQVCRPGMMEYEIQAEVENVFRCSNCDTAYPSIVASGHNSCILHYIENNSQLRDGDLLLIDAGAELDCYASDITRTFPVNGRYTQAQREIYEIVLDAQQQAIEKANPSSRFAEVHDASVAVIADGLKQLKLLDGSVDQIIEQETYKRFYMHKIGHWLGLDVHDAGNYAKQGESLQLEPGMCMTVEPGIYINPAQDVPESFHGIGIRIEDDVLITDQGNEILTSMVPKQPDEIEALMEGVQ